MLSTKNISYSVGEKKILHDISVDFLPGEFTMILGPNGSGKSTFLKIFCGELNPNTGSVKYSDIDVFTLKKIELAKMRAVMSQQPELAFPLTVEEVIMMGRYPHFVYNPAKKDELICHEIAERMDLADMKSRNYLTLSGGEKQRVQYARVLAQIWEMPGEGIRYLFMDEPLTSLDIRYQQEFLLMAKSLMNASTILVAVMHDINLAVQYADKLVFLKEGELVANGRPLDVISSNLINSVFDVQTMILMHPESGLPLVVHKG